MTTPPFIAQAILDLDIANTKLYEASALVSHVAREFGIAGGGMLSPGIIQDLDGSVHDIRHAMEDVVSVRRGLLRAWDQGAEVLE